MSDTNVAVPYQRPRPHNQQMDECDEWAGRRTPRGYGRVRVAGREVYAHRQAYERAFGAIPPGMLVCHHCDNPPCVRVSHLFLGTHMDNQRDKMAKGRHPRSAARGERHHSAKLTDDKVREIRALLAQGVPGSAVARRYGVSGSAVRFIELGQTWRHVR